jgi:hypothetical protein
MKIPCLFIFFFFIGFFSKAQEPIEMNDGAITSPGHEFKKPSGTFFYNNRLIYIKGESVYKRNSDKYFLNILLNSGNKDIAYLVKKAKINQKLEFIAFAAIPLGILASYSIRNNGTNNSSPAIGLTCIAASLTCIIISPIANHKKNANYKEAVKQYNLRF